MSLAILSCETTSVFGGCANLSPAFVPSRRNKKLPTPNASNKPVRVTGTERQFAWLLVFFFLALPGDSILRCIGAVQSSSRNDKAIATAAAGAPRAGSSFACWRSGRFGVRNGGKPRRCVPIGCGGRPRRSEFRFERSHQAVRIDWADYASFARLVHCGLTLKRSFTTE